MGVKRSTISWLLAGILITGTVTLSTAEDITFQGTTKTKAGDFVMLSGKLTKPQGGGPFPAVVMLYGCRGIDKAQDAWAGRLASWGYVALQVDSYACRGQKDICATPFIISFQPECRMPMTPNPTLPNFHLWIPTGSAVAGWSHGGALTIASVSPQNYLVWANINMAYADLTRKPAAPFRAAVALYPWIFLARLNDLAAPLLILTGEPDVIVPMAFLKANMPSEKSPYEVILKAYPGAYHTFDAEGVDITTPAGVKLKYDAAATSDAIVQVKEFLAKHLK